SVRDTRSATVGGLQTVDLLAALGQLGLDQDELCRAAGVDRQALDKPDSRIPTARFVAILTEAERLCRDPFIGMHAGERCEPGDRSLTCSCHTAIWQTVCNPWRAALSPPGTGSRSASTSDSIRPAWSSTSATVPSRVVRRPWSTCRWQSSARSGVGT